jgi:hypothetical protein
MKKEVAGEEEAHPRRGASRYDLGDEQPRKHGSETKVSWEKNLRGRLRSTVTGANDKVSPTLRATTCRIPPCQNPSNLAPHQSSMAAHEMRPHSWAISLTV